MSQFEACTPIAQIRSQCYRQHCDAVFEALAVSNQDLVPSEIQVFDAEVHAFAEPEASEWFPQPSAAVPSE